LVSGTDFQPAPSACQSIELATSASCPFGVIARLVGGPKIEFISGRLTTIFGFAGSVPMSTIVTASLPGGSSCSLPASSQMTLLSMPTTMYSGLPACVVGVMVQAVSSADPASNTGSMSRFIGVSWL
jgi:hypothetical protein